MSVDGSKPHGRPRPRAALVLPNGFTLANLFFGIFAIVAASRGDYGGAATFIVFGAIADTLDGRIARATNSGSKFGSELDSLVDAISFGTAPALIMYFAVLNKSGWDWIFCFIFTACAVMRLARFNVEQAGKAKTHFTGLPSPAAGLTLATYYWFSQTTLYNETMIGDLPWHQMLRWVMLGLGMLMISTVQYAAVPTVGFRSVREVLGSLLVIGIIGGVIFLPKEFFFPALMGYVLFGIGRTVLLGLMERLPARDNGLLDDTDDVDDDDERDDPLDDVAEVHDSSRPRRRRRRPHRHNNPGHSTGREDKQA